MPRLLNLFKLSRHVPHYRPRKPGMQDTSSSDNSRASPDDQLHQTTLEAVYTVPLQTVSNELLHIQTHVHLVSARIRHLQRLIEREGATLSHVQDLKRQLGNTCRDLARFHGEVKQELGERRARPLGHAEREIRQVYRRLERLEEELSVKTDGDERYMMSGALPYLEDPQDLIRDATTSIIDILHTLPQLIAYGTQPQDSPTSSDTPHEVPTRAVPETTNPEQWPQPRTEVIARLRHEETNPSLDLRDPDRVRVGSCNGYTVAQMMMFGIENHRFVLPYLHYIKHHELRDLKRWLIENDHVQKSGTISRIEKLLHCIQLLKTGNRYESIAVIFSRSPRQVQASCHEVMAGLLHLYDVTVDDACEQDVYASAWGIWKRFNLNVHSGRAERYYGFCWDEVTKVLVALNLYIARWRGSANGLEGRAFEWGRYLGVEGDGAVIDAIRRLEGIGERRRADEVSSPSPHTEPVLR